MAAQTANIEMMGYTKVLDVTAKLEGVLPQSVSGHSPVALFDVVYPGEDHEQVLMDLFANKSHLSHGYKLSVNNVTIGTTYLPWNKMFSGVARVTIEKMEEEVPYVPERYVAKNPDVPISPVYLHPNMNPNGQQFSPIGISNFDRNSIPQIMQPQIMQPHSLYYDSYHHPGYGGGGGGILLFALGVVAALGIVSIISSMLKK